MTVINAPTLAVSTRILEGKWLIKDPRAQSGFVFLMKKGEVGKTITVENRILEYSSLFDENDIARAKFRLDNWQELAILSRN